MHNQYMAADTAAVHAHDGDATHVVAVSALRVMLLEDSGGWFAQGLEVDYAAAGATIEEVKKNFADGFCDTIIEHLKLHGHIELLLRVAGPEAWAEFYQLPSTAIQQKFSCAQLHQLEPKEDIAFPFDNIAFITRDVIAKAKAMAPAIA